jgi:hypothetical protein
VAGAPDVLHDYPTRCIFCGEFVPITDDQPFIVNVTPWHLPTNWRLYIAHRACMERQDQAAGVGYA